MRQVYCIFTDMGYDGYVLEYVTDSLDKAYELAVAADPKQTGIIVIEEWLLNNMSDTKSKTIAVIKNGKREE